MAKGVSKKKQSGIEEFGFDEVDEFANQRTKELRSRAGLEEESDDNEEEEDEDDDDEENIEGVMDIDSDADIEQYKKKLQGPLDDSDEEYFRNEDEEKEDEENEDDWGNDYYGADDIEDEEDEKLLEEETMKLQKKHMEELNMEDFMVDEVEDWKKSSSDKNSENLDKEKLKEEEDKNFNKMVNDINSDKKSRMKMINKKYPEYVPLIEELKNLSKVHEDLKQENEQDGKGSKILEIQLKALSLYLGSIIGYLSIFVNKINSETDNVEMKDEDVMVSILSTREIWRQAKGLKEQEEGGAEVSEVEVSEAEASEIEEGEQVSDIQEEEEASENASETESEDESEAEEEQDKENDTPDFSKLRDIKTNSIYKNDADINIIDAEEKKGRRRALGFYTSKVDKKENLHRNVQGDMDSAYLDVDQKNFKRQPFSRDRGRGRGRGRARGRARRGRK